MKLSIIDSIRFIYNILNNKKQDKISIINLENIINFKFGNDICSGVVGDTIRTWVNSENNTFGYYIDNDIIYDDHNNSIDDIDVDTVIIDGAYYDD